MKLQRELNGPCDHYHHDYYDFTINDHRNNVLTVTIHPVQTGQYDGQPDSRCYQVCIPNFWPGKCSKLQPCFI